MALISFLKRTLRLRSYGCSSRLVNLDLLEEMVNYGGVCARLGGGLGPPFGPQEPNSRECSPISRFLDPRSESGCNLGGSHFSSGFRFRRCELKRTYMRHSVQRTLHYYRIPSINLLIMKRCDHSRWLGLYTQGSEVALLASDRLRTLTKYIQYPDIQKPSLLVLIGNAAKSVALRELFGVKRAWRLRSKQSAGEIHLHLDPSTIFTDRPIFLADVDLPGQTLRAQSVPKDNCHETTSHAIKWTSNLPGVLPSDLAARVYPRLLLPFTDVFCFFSTDLGGFRQIAIQIAAWLEKGSSLTLPKSTHPRVIIISDKIPFGTASEYEARTAFLWMLSEETTKDPLEQFSDINVVALFAADTMSVEARHRHLKERLMGAVDHTRTRRDESRHLFSATHFGALFEYACTHFAKTNEQPFSFVKASRTYNPVAPDLDGHLLTFLKHVRTPVELKKFAVPVIASSFLLDNYPPDAHGKSTSFAIRA